ncbi:hypothetical protein LINPERHAP1_LOCUS36361, partial [Linum perenne]
MDVRDQLNLCFEEYERMSNTFPSSTTNASLSIPDDSDTADFYATTSNLRRSGKSDLQMYLEDPLEKPTPLDILQW